MGASFNARRQPKVDSAFTLDQSVLGQRAQRSENGAVGMKRAQGGGSPKLTQNIDAALGQAGHGGLVIWSVPTPEILPVRAVGQDDRT